MKETRLVSEFENPKYLFLSDSQDKAWILEFVPEASTFDSFFILPKDDYDCDVVGSGVSEVWGLHGIIPYNHKIAVRLK